MKRTNSFFLKLNSVLLIVVVALLAVIGLFTINYKARELSRYRAKKILESHLNGPKHVKIPTGFVSFDVIDFPSLGQSLGVSLKKPSKEIYKRLEKEGIINLHDVVKIDESKVNKGNNSFSEILTRQLEKSFTRRLVMTFPDEIRAKYVKDIKKGKDDVAAWIFHKNYSFSPNVWNEVSGPNGENHYTGEVFIGTINPGKYRYYPEASGEFVWEWDGGKKSKKYKAKGTWHKDKVQKSLPFPKEKWGSAFLRIGDCSLLLGRDCIVQTTQNVFGELNIPRIEKNYETDRSNQTITVPLQTEKLFTKDIATVLLSDLTVSTINGISHSSSKNGYRVCFVDFMVDSSITPFGKALLPEAMQGSTIPFRALMVLFDDGWRLATDRVLPLELWDKVGLF